MLDCFWEFPLPFQRFAYLTHQEEIVDLFAGRIYGEAVHEYDSVKRMRRLLTMQGIDRTGVPSRAVPPQVPAPRTTPGPTPAAS